MWPLLCLFKFQIIFKIKKIKYIFVYLKLIESIAKISTKFAEKMTFDFLTWPRTIMLNFEWFKYLTKYLMHFNCYLYYKINFKKIHIKL